MSIDTEKQTLERLEAKLAEETARATDLQTERRKLSFSAHSGDAKARKALDAANASSATADLEIENVRSAIEEAKRRLAEAERAEEMTRLGENAEAAIAIAEGMPKRGQRIDEAFALIAAESKALVDDITKLNQLGCGSPRAEQLGVLGQLATNSALMFTPLRLRHLAPNERRDFLGFLTQWRDGVKRWASAFLEKEEAA
jgi:DNA repair exonuclease SbcCD ATPase subunit